ncbi:MAG: hypothetical protein SPL08_01405, partial [Pseudomonadota bacterium]|nr:hypothetical protein [Pseudomonadota bacterium]
MLKFEKQSLMALGRTAFVVASIFLSSTVWASEWTADIEAAKSDLESQIADEERERINVDNALSDRIDDTNDRVDEVDNRVA